jgi:hypothetical protein
MNYPQEILPNTNFKFIDCSLSDYYLIRTINTNNQELFWDKETNSLVIKYVCSPEERIDDLSMSLLGIYNIGHIYIDLTKEGKIKYGEYCEPDEIVDSPEFEIDFINNTDKHFWCAPINKLDNTPFDYTRGKDPFKATCIVKHTPTKWNFWHFSLRWITDLGPLEDLEEKLRSKVARRIGHAARVTISHFAIIHVPEHPIIPANFYCKN